MVVIPVVRDHWAQLAREDETKFKFNQELVSALCLDMTHELFAHIPPSAMIDLISMSEPFRQTKPENCKITSEVISAHFPSTRTEETLVSCFKLVPLLLTQLSKYRDEFHPHLQAEAALGLPKGFTVKEAIKSEMDKYKQMIDS